MSASTQPLLSNNSSQKKRLLGALQAAFEQNTIDDDNLLPCIIKSFDRTNNVAVVQPIISWVTIADDLKPRNELASINVLSLGGGGFHISFPLNPGDLAWIFAADRDISLFKQALAQSKPNTGRLHSFEDGLVIPDVFRKYTINAADAAAMVIQSTDGTTRIAISEGVINITAPTSVTVTTPIATFTGNVHIKQNLTVDQNATITQNATVSGSATLPSATTVGGTNVSNHGHTSSSPGTRTSGGMIA